jgi:hypothetical protein
MVSLTVHILHIFTVYAVSAIMTTILMNLGENPNERRCPVRHGNPREKN